MRRARSATERKTAISFARPPRHPLRGSRFDFPRPRPFAQAGRARSRGAALGGEVTGLQLGSAMRAWSLGDRRAASDRGLCARRSGRGGRGVVIVIVVVLRPRAVFVRLAGVSARSALHVKQLHKPTRLCSFLSNKVTAGETDIACTYMSLSLSSSATNMQSKAYCLKTTKHWVPIHDAHSLYIHSHTAESCLAQSEDQPELSTHSPEPASIVVSSSFQQNKSGENGR